MPAAPREPVLLQPRRPNPVRMLVAAGVLAALAVWTLWFRQPNSPTRHPPAGELIEISGDEQGTQFHIKIFDANLPTQRVEAASAAIGDCLAEINREMSLWDPRSEISRFNREPAGPPFAAATSFVAVTRFALDLAGQTGGVFDPTIGPLIKLWGFGPGGGRTNEPPADEQRAVAARVGWRHVTTPAADRLAKDADGVQLDLNAVAQGYSCDLVASRIAALGFTNFFVEIGGEVYASGHNSQGEPWRIGIDQPRYDAVPGERIEGVLHVTDVGVATSGDYRHFRKESSGRSISHIFDPRTGRPVEREQTSVTVVAPDGMTADGLATALFVMGPEEGLRWLEQAHPEACALFIVFRGDGRCEEIPSRRFQQVTGYRPMNR